MNNHEQETGFDWNDMRVFRTVSATDRHLSATVRITSETSPSDASI
jgi:hypothetical protein